MNKKQVRSACFLSLLVFAFSCGSKSTSESTAKPTNDSITKPATPVAPAENKPAAVYNVVDKANGTYARIPGEKYESAWSEIPMQVVVKVEGKKIYINKRKYKFETVYIKQDTLLTFGEVSEESGDFLGGGEISINGNKVMYKMIWGADASEEFLFKKK